MVKNVNPGSEWVSLNGVLYFRAAGGLWKSDGTPEGTVLIKSITFPSLGSLLTNVDGTLFFMASGVNNVPQLYKSDGTVEGTVIVTNLPTSEVKEFTSFQGALFFDLFDFKKFEYNLWRSDGTPEGTGMFKDLPPPPIGFVSVAPDQMTVVGQTLFFVYGETSTGLELWKSDGTPDGTALVKDIRPDRGVSTANSPQNLTNVGGTLFFSTRDGTLGSGINLWKSDGTADGTVLVKDFSPGINRPFGSNEGDLPLLANVDGTLFFRAATGFTDDVEELWKSDGTTAGTVVVPRAGNITASAIDITSSSYSLVGNLAYFIAVTRDSGLELARTDGTPSGTFLVKDIFPGRQSSKIIFLAALNGKQYFVADDGVHGRELWQSDGTIAGTFMVQDICADACSSSPGEAVIQNGKLLFTADDGIHGKTSWQTDGTPTGTVPNPDYIAALKLAAKINGTYYFAASDGTNGTELWKSDGTQAGTMLLKDIYTGPLSSFPQELTAFNGKLFFAATDATHGATLWMSDGTPEGTVLVKDSGPGFTLGPPQLFIVNNQLLYLAVDGNGRELWRSDGTADGTVLVKDIMPGSSSSNADELTVFDDQLLFLADDGTNGRELWRSDGTADGTFLVKDIWQGSFSSDPDIFVDGFFVVNDILVFAANDGTTGSNLWRSDGTPDGTFLLKDANTSTAGVNGPQELTPIDGTLFFSVGDAPGLWKTDGTAEGTIQLSQNSPSVLTIVDQTLFFQSGKSSIWTSDGTVAGTAQVVSVGPKSSPNPLFLLNGNLIFNANDFAHGREIWAVVDVNVAPSFSKGADIGLTDEQAGAARVYSQWATAISVGPADEAAQQLTFLVENDNHGLFSQQPKIDPDGTLTFTLQPNMEGMATVTVKLEDDGGTANGGADTSAAQTFTIDITKPHRWHNEMPPFSPVNRGGMEVLFEDDLYSITSTDVLLIINYLNAGLPTKIPANAPVANGTTRPFYDVDGDDSVTSTDALLIINVLNAGQGGPVGGEGEGISPLPATMHKPPKFQPALADLVAMLAVDVTEQSLRRRRGW